MAKPMTKSEVAAAMAQALAKRGVELSKKQVNIFFEEMAQLAYKQAKNSFIFPGVGKLVLQDRPARKMIMQFGPKKGQEVTVPKKKVVKFKLLKVAKDQILGTESGKAKGKR